MKASLPALLVLMSLCAVARPETNRAGFYLPDHLAEVTFRYRQANNLIILPVVLNDSIEVNLILDTGCRNLVLFGKSFQDMFKLEAGKSVQFSGLGTGKPLRGDLSLNNKVFIHEAIGERIPVVVIADQNLFGSYRNVHGVIGYDIFTKFEVELNPSRQEITLRPAATATLCDEYQHIPLRVEDSRPLLQGKLALSEGTSRVHDLMIDTGSTLGLLIKAADLTAYSFDDNSLQTLGRGLNGKVQGIETVAYKLQLQSLELKNISTGIIHSPWNNYSSIGMDLLKDYILVLNYCKGYAGLKKA